MNASLPVIAGKAEAKMRTKDATVDRLFALALVSLKGEGLEQEKVLKLQTELGAGSFLSPKEAAFLTLAKPDAKERAQFAWRYECVYVLHWALGYVAELEKPTKIVDAALVIKLLREPGSTRFRTEAKLRSLDELLDQADLIYRYDWACVDARVAKKPAPADIDCEVVVERHHALNWLYGYQAAAWDDVSTDT